eukprot:2555629-Amphidinium_carterae.1
MSFGAHTLVCFFWEGLFVVLVVNPSWFAACSQCRVCAREQVCASDNMSDGVNMPQSFSKAKSLVNLITDCSSCGVVGPGVILSSRV